MAESPQVDTGEAGLHNRLPFLRGLPRDVGVVSAICFCVALGFGIVIPALPVFAKGFGVTAFLAAAVVSVFALVRLISAPIAGRLVNRVGERVVLSSGLMIVAVSSLLAGFSQNYVQLLILRGVGGLGSAMFTVSALALILRVTTTNQRGRASSAFQFGFLLGGISGPAVGGLVVGISIRAPFFVYAATLGLATFVSLTFLRNDKPAQAGSTVPDGQESPTVQAPVASIGTAIRSRAYQAALGANFVNGILTFGIRTSLVPLFVVESLARGPGLAGVGFLAAALTQAGSLPFAGRMTDQRGRRPALLVGLVTTLVGAAMLTAASEPILFVAAMAVMGVGTGFLGSSPPAIVGDVTGPARGGTVVAAFQMIADLGAIAGPLLAGLLADQLGYHWAFGSSIAIVAIALILALRMPETRVSEPEPTAVR